MKNKIKHFIVDLEELQGFHAYDSEIYTEIKMIIRTLNTLIDKLEVE